APVESVYSKVRHFEGETLSVQCSYKSRKNHIEGKVWCKIRRKKCETVFTRVGVQGPRYLLQDDTQAKVVSITMAALRRQDSGRYWCMRNSSGILYPLMGFLLEVSPASTTKRNTPLTKLPTILQSGTVVTAGPALTSGPDAPFTTSTTVFTPGLFTLPRLLPFPASGSIRLTSVTGYGFTGASPSTTGPRRTMGSQTVTASPSNAGASTAGPASTPTKAGHLCTTGSPTTGMCPTGRSLLNQLSPSRHQDFHPAVLVAVLALLPVPVMLVVVYGFWKKRHMGTCAVILPDPGGTHPQDRSLRGSLLGLKPLNCMVGRSFSQRASPCPWGKKESQKQPVSQGSHPGGEEGTVTKSWGSTKVLGIPELSKPPSPWAKCPLRGLWMGPDLTVAACPSSPGSQQGPHSRCCCLLAGASREGCDRAAESPSPAGPACPWTCMQRLIRALSPSSHTLAPGLSS
ncbi:hypothetical protein E2I00_002070, partial [Balaenoptera physalus]